MNLRTRCALAIASGVLEVLGFIGFGLFPLTWIAKVPVLLAVSGQSLRRTFLLGLLYGAVTHLGGYYWLNHALIEFAELGVVVSAALLLLIATGFGLLFALLLWCVRRAQRDLGIAPVWSLLVAYPAVEFVFPNLFAYNIGASQYRFTAITQIVEVTGLLGLTALIGMVNGAVYELLEARLAKRRVITRRWAVPAAAFGLVLAFGLIRIAQVDARIASARHITVGLVQTNLAAGDKEQRHREFIDVHRAMTRELIAAHPEVELIVWPETAYNAPLPHDVKNVRDELQPQRPMIVGAMVQATGGSSSLKFNSVLAVAPDGDVTGRFDKVRLLTFGEAIPFVETFPGLRNWFPDAVTVRGTHFENLQLSGVTLLPTICYEDILPDQVRKMWHRAGPPDVLVNVSNEVWFGDSHEPLVHLALASLRSIETRRALIRSTQTGISAFVDPVGRIISRTGQWQREVLVDQVPLIADGGTTLYLRTGDALGWACVALSAAGLVACIRARRKTV